MTDARTARSRTRPPATLVVLMGDAVAGVLHRLDHGRLRFVYDDAYRRSPSATPLSLSMPLLVPAHEDRVVHPWLQGLLPDNEAVLRRWGQEFQASPSSPYALLATPVGEDCAGAVRFARPDDVARLLAREGHVAWLSEDEVAARLRALRSDVTAWHGEDLDGRFSLAGAQAKTALLYEGGRWGVPSGAIPTSHIIKPTPPRFEGLDLVEHLCLDAARRAGLLAAATRVACFGDETAIVVERYDRRRDEHGLTRLHQEDLCQALGVAPQQKYQAAGGPSPEQIVDLFRRRLPVRAADDAIARFVDALAWNWIIGGTDAHAKNYSVLLAGPNARLAPLYDVASLLPYTDDQDRLKMAMKIGDEYGLPLRSFRRAHQQGFPDPWEKAARSMRLDGEAVRRRVQELAAIAPDAFAAAAAVEEVRAIGSTLPARLVDRIGQRAAACARALDPPAVVRRGMPS